MKALVFDGALRLEERELVRSTPDEACIRLIKAGICNTDLEITRGYFGFKGVLGHEFVGVVEDALDPALRGRRVVGEINAGCGRCEYCLRNLRRHCPHRSVLGILGRDGAFQEYFSLPVGNLHLVPDGLSDDQAVFVEPLAAACEILDQLQLQPHQQVAVLGDGKLGLLVAMVLSQIGCDLSLIGRHPAKMRLVEDYRVRTIPSQETGHLGRCFDVVVEATGSSDGWHQALSLLKPRGYLVLKSTYHGPFAFNPAPLVVDETTVIGSRCGRFEPALRLLQTKTIDPSRLIAYKLPLVQGVRAFELASQPGVLKVILDADDRE
jgi:threonine dehydrogenase-like Zn-dependent dehydrogenase